MLYLVSLGVWDVKDMSIKAYEVLKEADVIYIERYTSKTAHTAESLSFLLNKKVIELSRAEIEEHAHMIVEHAKSQKVAICSPGDVFFATTHLMIIPLCIKRKVKYKIISGSSILTAIGKIGLSLYKFGRTVSLPHPSLYPIYPKTPFENIEINSKQNMHTLVLLDIGMRCLDAFELFEKHFTSFIKDKKIIACYALGSENEAIVYGSIEEIKHVCNKWDDKAQCIIIPSSNLEFYEEEILELWKVRSYNTRGNKLF